MDYVQAQLDKAASVLEKRVDADSTKGERRDAKRRKKAYGMRVSGASVRVLQQAAATRAEKLTNKS